MPQSLVSKRWPPALAGDEFLLAVLNSTPAVGGAPSDNLADLGTARRWLVAAGGLGTGEELTDLTGKELAHLRRARTALQAVVRGELAESALGPLLRGVSYVPQVRDRITWNLKVPADHIPAVRAVLAYHALASASPGRLRPCANDECRLFLIDRSSANRARWCSMAVCGNRMKARRHYRRTRDGGRS